MTWSIVQVDAFSAGAPFRVHPAAVVLLGDSFLEDGLSARSAAPRGR